jgi:hypothetical protein
MNREKVLVEETSSSDSGGDSRLGYGSSKSPAKKSSTITNKSSSGYGTGSSFGYDYGYRSSSGYGSSFGYGYDSGSSSGFGYDFSRVFTLLHRFSERVELLKRKRRGYCIRVHWF